MNKKTLIRISTLENSIIANNSIAQSHPELLEDLSDKNKSMMKEIEDIKNPPIKVEKKGDVEIGVDLGWNCIAVQKNGSPCQSKRKHGKYCGRHLIYYVKELEDKYECQ